MKDIWYFRSLSFGVNWHICCTNYQKKSFPPLKKWNKDFCIKYITLSNLYFNYKLENGTFKGLKFINYFDGSVIFRTQKPSYQLLPQLLTWQTTHFLWFFPFWPLKAINWCLLFFFFFFFLYIYYYYSYLDLSLQSGRSSCNIWNWLANNPRREILWLHQLAWQDYHGLWWQRYETYRTLNPFTNI